MLLLKNGLLHTMTQDAFAGDILIDNGKIAAIGASLSAEGAEVIDLGRGTPDEFEALAGRLAVFRFDSVTD